MNMEPWNLKKMAEMEREILSFKALFLVFQPLFLSGVSRWSLLISTMAKSPPKTGGIRMGKNLPWLPLIFLGPKSGLVKHYQIYYTPQSLTAGTWKIMVSNRNLLFLGAAFQLPCFKLQVFFLESNSLRWWLVPGKLWLLCTIGTRTGESCWWTEAFGTLCRDQCGEGLTYWTWVGKISCRYHNSNMYIYTYIHTYSITIWMQVSIHGEMIWLETNDNTTDGNNKTACDEIDNVAVGYFEFNFKTQKNTKNT